MVSSIRNPNPEKVLKDMQKWKIPEIEKKKIPEFINEYRSGRISGRIGKGIEGTLESVTYQLKIPLEFINKPVNNMTESDIKYFFDSLINDKIKAKVRKNVNGKLKAVELRPYKIKGKIKYLRTFSQYLKYRLDKKPERVSKFLKILKVVITTVEHEAESLSYEEYDKLYDASSELWQKYFHEVNVWGGFRAGEFHPILESDIKFPEVNKGENFVKIWIRHGNSKTKGRMVTLYGGRCFKIVREYLEKRKAEGLKPDEPVFEKNYQATKTWIRRFGKRVLNKNIHHHLYRSTCATWLVDKGIFTDRTKLCLFFSWKFSSPMPDVYLNRRGISLDEVDRKVKQTDLEELKVKLDKQEYDSKIKDENFNKISKDNETMKEQMKQILELVNEMTNNIKVKN